MKKNKAYIYFLADPRKFDKSNNYEIYDSVENVIGASQEICQVIKPKSLFHESYVGQTINIDRRHREHIRIPNNKSRDLLSNWKRKLSKEGVEPILIPIIEIDKASFESEESLVELLNALEILCIQIFRLHGKADKNTTDGGEGFTSKARKKALEAMGAAGRKSIALKTAQTTYKKWKDFTTRNPI